MDSLETHRALLEQLSQPGQDLGPNSPHRTIKNRELFTSAGKSKGARRELHNKLVASVLAEADAGSQALIISGPPGAGKSTVRHHALNNSTTRFATIDADIFKEALINASLNDGTFEGYFHTPKIVELQQAGHVFHPFEFASLVHDESSKLAKNALDEAIGKGLNIIIDGVGASEQALTDRLSELHEAGYTTTIIDVECPREVSERAIQQRWEHGRTEALNHNPEYTLGGRWVPRAVLDRVFPQPDGPSAPEIIHKAAAHTSPTVVAYQLWRRSSATSTHQRELNLVRGGHGGKLIDKDATQALNTAHGIRSYRPQHSYDNGHER